MLDKLIFIGGFLGSGKTTLLAEAARRLAQQGRAVRLVTNNQAPELVDTLLLQSFFRNVLSASRPAPNGFSMTP